MITEAEIGVMSTMPRIAGNIRSWKRQEGSSPRAFGGEHRGAQPANSLILDL